MNARDIGALYGVSKNTIIGISYRNGFSVKRCGVKGAHKPGGRVIGERKPQPRLSKAAETRRRIHRHIDPLVQYGPKAGKCKNVEERISYGVFRYCDAPAVEGTSWCAHHYDLFHWKPVRKGVVPHGMSSDKELEKVSGGQA